MKGVIIRGNAKSQCDVHIPNFDLWVLGTNKTGLQYAADRIFEFHGLPIDDESKRWDFNNIALEKMKINGFPLHNSICYMLAQAIIEGVYDEILLVGAPCTAKAEYLKERPSVAWLVGYAVARGIKVFWEGGLSHETYMGV